MSKRQKDTYDENASIFTYESENFFGPVQNPVNDGTDRQQHLVLLILLIRETLSFNR